MSKNVKKYSLLILIGILLLGSFFCEKIVRADSGWDSDYDSGSSWDSDSSWDSSSSWSSSESGIYTSGDLGDTDPIMILILLVIIILVIALSTKKRQSIDKNPIPYYKKTLPNGLSPDEIKAIDPSLDIEKLKEQAFHIYKNVQIAWMNFDYDTLRKYLTDEIYNMYSSQLKTLKIKNQKNIMKEIELQTCEIIEINIENGIEEIKVYLNVTQYDYVVDKDNQVVRGTDKYKNNMEYRITLVRNVEKKKIDKCPNCGANIDIVSGGVCPYCDSTIINNNEEFVMSKKEVWNSGEK